MLQFTSPEDLEKWLRGKPVDWAQVVAMRAALRALPCAFEMRIRQRWLDDFGFNLIRAIFVAWAAGAFSIDSIKMTSSAAARATRALASYALGNPAAFAVAYAVRSARRDLPEHETLIDVSLVTYILRSVDQAAESINKLARDWSLMSSIRNPAAYVAEIAADDATQAGVSAQITVWANTSWDCTELKEQPVADFSADILTARPLWPLNEPLGWRANWQYASARLLALDPSYQVWIDWYNRRIEGYAEAFDIPFDIDRAHDKSILERLAGATEEDFWGKGAIFVNTTLQNWINEARQQAVIDYVASGARLNLGSEAELLARRELQTRLGAVEAELAKAQDQLTSLSTTGHGAIGHNQPDNEPSVLQEEMGLLRQRVAELEITVAAMAAAFTELNSAIPVASSVVAEPAQIQAAEAVAKLVALAPELNKWGRMTQPLENATSPEVKKGFDNAAGATLFAAIIGTPYFVYTTLPEAIASFLHYLYTVWFPILPG